MSQIVDIRFRTLQEKSREPLRIRRELTDQKTKRSDELKTEVLTGITKTEKRLQLYANWLRNLHNLQMLGSRNRSWLSKW